jgi:hypothetical protein
MDVKPEHNTARTNGRFAPGVSGNPGGSPEASRRLVNKAFLQSMARAWAKYGDKALEKCAKNQPAAFCKMYVLLVPREMKVEHTQGVKELTDDQLEAAIQAVREMIQAREAQAAQSVTIEGKAEPVALPASGQGSQGER